MNKRDRQGVRTASDLERKYKFGDIEQSKQNVNSAKEGLGKVNQLVSQYMSTINSKLTNLQEQITENKNNLEAKLKAEGWKADKYLGTDANGKVVEKDKPSYTASDIKTKDGGTVEDKLSNTLSLLSVYPVGAIYMSVTDTDPSTLFGGTWERFAKGQVLVGVDEEDEDFSESQKTGGKKSDAHMHETNFSFDGSEFFARATNENNESTIDESVARGVITPTATGEGRSRRDSTWSTEVSLLQPYITCYMWKRTA